MVIKKGGERIMELLKRLVVEEEGQGLTEYTLIVLLVALVFWIAVRETNVDQALSNAWLDVVNCLGDPFAGGCSAS
jgi:Flp pilus assembly pilin Flp